MRSMSLFAARGALAVVLGLGSASLAAVAHAQSSDPYADSYRAYHQQYGHYDTDDQDDASYGGAPRYGQGAYGGYNGYGGRYRGGYDAPSYGVRGYNAPGYGQSYGRQDYNSDSYGGPGDTPPPNASAGYHHDYGSPAYDARSPVDNDYGYGSSPNPYGPYYGQGGSDGSGYPLPPN